MARTRNLILGVSLLLVVDVIWVLSNELTKVRVEVSSVTQR